MKREDCQRGGMIHTGFSVSTFRESLDEFIHKPQIKSQIRSRHCKTKQVTRLFHSRDIAVCPESPPLWINTSWLARQLFIYRGDIFQRIFAWRLRFFVLWSGDAGVAALEGSSRRTPRSLSRRKVLHLYQVSITSRRTWHSQHFIDDQSDGGWWETLKLSGRRRFREWWVWMIRTMHPRTSWRGPVMWCGGKTCCKHIMQRISHPWPFSYTVPVSVMNSLAKPERLIVHLLTFRCWTCLPLLSFCLHQHH